MNEVKVLIDEETITKRIDKMAQEIMRDYGDKKLTLICILKGSIYFTTELSKRIKNEVELEFMRVSSYGNSTESSGNLDVKLDLSDSIEGKDVIIIEDIIDTGRTLSYLKEYIITKKPNSVKICSLLDKKERRVCKLEGDYIGFLVPDKFIVGYGIDYAEKYRNLPYIGYIEK